jgi:hypothetical protein
MVETKHERPLMPLDDPSASRTAIDYDAAPGFVGNPAVRAMSVPAKLLDGPSNFGTARADWIAFRRQTKGT